MMIAARSARSTMLSRLVGVERRTSRRRVSYLASVSSFFNEQKVESTVHHQRLPPRRHLSSSSSSFTSLFNPTDEHKTLRETLRTFVENEVEPQALEYNKTETFNVNLFRKLGDLGILGLTVDEEFGGSGFDATSVALVHEELSYADPAFCLSYLAHSLLLVNNLHVNGSHEQKLAFLPAVCSGERIGGMCMSESGAGTDVLGMKTNAVYDKSAGGWILNGTKVCACDVLLLLCS